MYRISSALQISYYVPSIAHQDRIKALDICNNKQPFPPINLLGLEINVRGPLVLVLSFYLSARVWVVMLWIKRL